MKVLEQTLQITGVSMAAIFAVMAGLYVVIKVMMNGERNKS